MLTFIGAGLTVVLLIFTIFAAWHRRIGGGGIVAFGVISIVAGATIANYPRLESLAVHAGENKSFDVKWREVKDAAEQGEQTVSQIHGAVEEADRKLVDVLDVQKQQAPRRLSVKQKQALVKALSPFRGQKVSVACIWGDTDGHQFAKDFESVFVEAGWSFPTPGVTRVVYSQDPVGIEVNLNQEEVNAGRIPQAALMLADALVQLGVVKERTIFRNSETPVSQVHIIVGRRPPSEVAGIEEGKQDK